MNELDRKIQEALRGVEGGDALAREPNMAEELIGTFRGRHRWMLGLAVVFSFVVFAVALWAGIEFYNAEAVRDQFRWGGLCLVCLLSVSFIKVYFWMELHTNRILREVKRVELLHVQRSRS